MNDRAQKFEKFDRENPEVFSLYCRFALQALKQGAKRLSGRLIYERIRWETTVVTTDRDYKLNDHHLPHYNRKFVSAYPHFADYFEFRSTQGAA